MAKAEKVSDRAELLIQSITDYAIYMLDASGIVSTWNSGARRLKGYTHEEIIGSHFSRFYTPEDQQAGKPAKALEVALREGRFEAEGWRVHKDGSRFWANVVVDPIYDQDGQHIGFAKITRDLSERRDALEALRRSEERFRLLVQGVKDYAIYMLDPEGNVSSWNAGAERIKGYSADEIIGQHFSTFYPEEDRAQGIPYQALTIALAQGKFEAEGWRLRKNGLRFWADVVIDPIHDSEGVLLGFTKITRDLTERKETRETLEKTQEQFSQSQKMEAIGNLTGGVAHDFNNLLAVIMGSLSLAQKRLAEGQDISRFLDNAQQAALRGAMLTQRMLAFARKQDLALEPLDVVVCVRDMAEMLERTIGVGIAISTHFPLILPPVMADRAQFELALMNLAVNARDAMPDGGTITISARKPADGSAFVEISVEDEGEGMDNETLAQATAPFFTTKGVGKGSGLGLSMVQGMVEQCGGQFELSSEPGKGTKATISLPMADAGQTAAATSQAEPVDEAEAAGRPLRILAVDDDALILMNTAMMLSDLGHEAFEAMSAAEALTVLAEQEIDLLITDFSMPGMTGNELITEARKIQPGLLAIIASGYADLPAGQDMNVPRLAKPFTEAALADVVRKVAAG